MEAKFRISEEEYVSALRLYGKPTPKLVVTFCLVMGALALLAIFGSDLFGSVALGALIGLGIAIVLGRYVVAPILARRHYRKYKAIQDEFGIHLEEDGIYIESSNVKGTLPWSNVLKWREDEEFLLLYLMPRLFHIVPKNIAQQGFDISLLVDRLNKNIGKSV